MQNVWQIKFGDLVNFAKLLSYMVLICCDLNCQIYEGKSPKIYLTDHTGSMIIQDLYHTISCHWSLIPSKVGTHTQMSWTKAILRNQVLTGQHTSTHLV